ncbi:MAG TPA: xylose isomerase, partial [Bacillales bacterium]
MGYFSEIESIKYEGRDSKNPLAFKYYNPEEVIGDKTMKEHLRFSVAYWHTLTMDGTDPFGAPTMVRPWDRYSGMDLAKARVEAAFELFEKLGTPYFCFHDVDIAPEGETLAETNRNLDEIVG